MARETQYLSKEVPRIDALERVTGQAYEAFVRSDVLAPWYRHLYTFGLLVSAITAFVLFGTIVLMRQTSSLAAKTRALARTNAIDSLNSTSDSSSSRSSDVRKPSVFRSMSLCK